MFDLKSLQSLRGLIGRDDEGAGDVVARLDLSRHDDHNLELKSAFELDRQGLRASLDFFLFVPRSMHLGDAARAELRSDMHARVRLSVPREVESDTSLLAADAEKLRCLLAALDDPRNEGLRGDVADEIFQVARHAGALLGEVVKHRAKAHHREVLLAHSLAGAPSQPSAMLTRVAAEAEEIAGLVSGIRRAIRVPAAAALPVLPLLDQYLHPLYVDYLVTVRAELERILENAARFSKARYESGWDALRGTLDRLQAAEAAEGAALGWGRDDERLLVQHGQRKKFFQAEMFVEVSQREALRRISEPLAALGATFAAVVALLVERSLNPEGSSLGFQSMFALSVGVALYVVRDRLKDVAKAWLARKVGRLLPDVQSEMVAEGRPIGSMSEWLAVKARSALPAEVQAARSRACITEAERHIPEDVLHLRKVYEIKPDRAADTRLALQEVVRINLERHLKHMDDPLKGVRRLEADGRFSVVQQRRVYYFHACLSASFEPLGGDRDDRPAPGPAPQMFRVVLDKNGIVRVDELAADGSVVGDEPLGGETPIAVPTPTPAPPVAEPPVELAARLALR